MKHLKTFESHGNYRADRYEFYKYPLNEKLMDLFDKYNTEKHDNYYGEPERVRESDVLESLEMIQGDGEVITSGQKPYYLERFGDTVLVVHGSTGGLISKWLYEYEIKVLSESSKRTTQIGGGYGTSGFDMSSYRQSAMIHYGSNPQIIDKTVISKVINEFRELLR